MSVDPWNEIDVSYPVFHRRFPLILLVALLASCDERKPDEESSGQEADSPRRVRNERPPKEAARILDALRKDYKVAQKRLSSAERDRDLAEVAWKAIEWDHALAAEVILEISSGSEEKKSLIETYIQMMLERGQSEEAETWAASLGNEADSQVALSKIGELSGQAHPEKDALSLSESDFTGGVNPGAEQVIRSWAVKNPTQAVEWLRKMPEGEARANGFKILLTAWVVRDSSTAFSWISTQRNPQLRQEALTGVVGFLDGQPAPIRNSLLEAADETVRHEILQRIAELSPSVENDGESKPEEVPQPGNDSPSEPELDEQEDAPAEELNGE